jgi:hypothetical protein
LLVSGDLMIADFMTYRDGTYSIVHGLVPIILALA